MRRSSFIFCGAFRQCYLEGLGAGNAGTNGGLVHTAHFAPAVAAAPASITPTHLSSAH